MPSLVAGESGDAELFFHRVDPWEISVRDDNGGSLTVHGQLTEIQTHALRVLGSEPGGGYEITVNGETLVGAPLSHDDDAWYLVPPDLLRTGENEFVIAGPPGEELHIQEIECSALAGVGEEVHFAQMVRSGAQRMFAPPIHADQQRFNVEHVDLQMTLDMASRNIPSAVMTMTATSLDSGLTQCVLDLNDNGGAFSVTAVDDGASNPLAFTQSGAEDRVFVTLPGAVPSGNAFTVRLFYSGTPASISGQGYLRTTHGPAAASLIYTHSQAFFARSWWPCKDFPEDKFTIDTHVTVPNTVHDSFPLSVVSNGSLASVVDNGDGTNTFNWSEGYPIATQYVSVVCTNFRVDTGAYTSQDTPATMEVSHHVWPEAWASQSGRVSQTIEILDFFADNFGEYPFLTEKYANVVWGLGFGLEHQTATSINSGSTGLGSDYTRRNVHEAMHMWFGTSAGNETFDHLWLSEAWATYAEALFQEHRLGTAAYHSYVNGWSTNDDRPIIHPDNDSFSFPVFHVVYRKGAWVLHMLRHIIGDDAFFTASRNYAMDPTLRHGTAVTDDFVAHVNAAVGEDMGWYFDQWLLRASRPRYEWGWTTGADGGDTVLALFIEQVQADAVYRMPIDFEIEFGDLTTAVISVENTRRAEWFNINLGLATVNDVTFDPDNWLLESHTEVTPALREGLMLSAVADEDTPVR